MQEAIANPVGLVCPHAEAPELQALFTDCLPIESTETCRTFELIWDRYVAYLVTEECAGSCGRYEDEIFTGTLFRVYTKSHFLEHLVRDTGAHSKEIQHYKLICLNHLIDIAAYGPAEIKQIGPKPSLRIQ